MIICNITNHSQLRRAAGPLLQRAGGGGAGGGAAGVRARPRGPRRERGRARAGGRHGRVHGAAGAALPGQDGTGGASVVPQF